MGFQFNIDLYDEKVRKKYLDAEREKELVYHKYPEIKEVDEYLSRLKKEHRLLQVQNLLQPSQEKLKNSTQSLSVLQEEIKALEEKFKGLLQQYNVPANFKEPKWDCPRCMDTGRLLENGITRTCPCASRHRLQSLIQRAGLPKRLERANFQDLNLNLYSPNPMEDSSNRSIRENAKLVFDAAKDFAFNFEKEKYMRGMLIEGPVGSGKSYLLGSIANYLIDREIEIRYIVYGDLIETIKASFNSENRVSTEDILRELQEVPVLLIDDLGTEYITEFTSSILYQIVDKRYREERPFIVTTNFSPNELSRRMGLMGERIFQRMVETCRYLQLVGNVREQIAMAKRGADQ